MSDNIVLDYFSDEDQAKIVSSIATKTQEYYTENREAHHPSVFFVYGVREQKINGEVYYLDSIEQSEEYFTQLGYQTAGVLEDVMVPFLVVLSLEATITFTKVDTEEKIKKEAIIVMSLTVDGRKIVLHQMLERDEDNNITIVDNEKYGSGDVSLLTAFYDGVREFYLEQKLDTEDIVKL